MTTRNQLQALLQKRLNVLHVELSAAMQSRAATTEEKLDTIHSVGLLAGARMELVLLARFLGIKVQTQIEVTRSEEDLALYPSSEIYEAYLRHVEGQSRKVS